MASKKVRVLAGGALASVATLGHMAGQSSVAAAAPVGEPTDDITTYCLSEVITDEEAARGMTPPTTCFDSYAPVLRQLGYVVPDDVTPETFDIMSEAPARRAASSGEVSTLATALAEHRGNHPSLGAWMYTISGNNCDGGKWWPPIVNNNTMLKTRHLACTRIKHFDSGDCNQAYHQTVGGSFTDHAVPPNYVSCVTYHNQ